MCLLLRNGQIDSVISELNRVYPDFLQKRQDILFKLLVCADIFIHRYLLLTVSEVCGNDKICPY